VFEADERAEAEVEAAGAVLEERPREEKPEYKRIVIAISNSIPYRSGPSRGGCIEEWEKRGGLTGATCDPGTRSPAQGRSNVSVLARRRRKRLGR
jgi:hypothetical protein